MKLARFGRAAVLAALVAAVLAGCSGGGAPGSAPAAPPTVGPTGHALEGSWKRGDNTRISFLPDGTFRYWRSFSFTPDRGFGAGVQQHGQSEIIGRWAPAGTTSVTIRDQNVIVFDSRHPDADLRYAADNPGLITFSEQDDGTTRLDYYITYFDIGLPGGGEYGIYLIGMEGQSGSQPDYTVGLVPDHDPPLIPILPR